MVIKELGEGRRVALVGRVGALRAEQDRVGYQICDKIRIGFAIGEAPCCTRLSSVSPLPHQQLLPDTAKSKMR